jgi:hypothetical protein|tara:strand:- start:950 stop:1597 length:648 start_codon:yes stop_codon:yes gene_type:complete
MKLKDIYKKIDSLNEAVNMSISMSGETADDVATLMKMVKDAGGKPEIMAPMGPKMSPRDDIEKSLKVMDLPPMPKEMPKGMPDMEPGCEDEVAKEGDWDNAPDEKYQDTAYMQNDLAGGLNRQKKSYPKVAGGDNPMALEDEIKSELKSRLEAMMAVKDEVTEAEDKDFDESGCVGEMKKLNNSGCTKEEMKKKITAEYDCDSKKFEKLYASHCG